jgi:hypothetical protein
MRFTLCKLFLGVTMAALASAGMTLHTRLWAEAIVSFSIIMYAAVAILAFRRGCDSRAFRTAFATVGGFYLMLVFCNTFSPIRDLLITNRVIVRVGEALNLSTYESFGGGFGGGGFQLADPANVSADGTGMTIFGTAVPLSTIDYNWNSNSFAYAVPIANPRIPAGAFLIIGHCVWSWLLALAAGCFAAFACRPRTSAAAN